MYPARFFGNSPLRRISFGVQRRRHDQHLPTPEPYAKRGSDKFVERAADGNANCATCRRTQRQSERARINGLGAASAQSVEVQEIGYTGGFDESDSCTAIAAVAPTIRQRPIRNIYGNAKRGWNMHGDLH